MSSSITHLHSKKSSYIKDGIKLSDLDFNLIDTNDPKKNELSLYKKSYNLWKSVWEETYQKELHVKDPFYSDSFIFNKILGVLSYQGSPVGLALFNTFNINLEPFAQHSFFKDYPKEALTFLKGPTNTKIMTMGNLAVAPNWRKKKTFISISEIVVGFSVKTFQKSSAEKLIALTRNSRRVNETLYLYGGLPLKKNHSTQFDSNVDIIVYTQKTVCEHPNKKISFFINDLWPTNDINIAA